MLGRLRSRLTYANVASTIAMVAALGTGGAYAANTVGSADIIDESILTQDIKNAEVKNADVGADAITTAKLATGAVKNADLGADAVTTAKIATNGVGNADLAASAVTGAKIADATIAADDLADSAVTSPKIAADAIGSREIAAGIVGAEELDTFHEHFGPLTNITDGTAHDGAYAFSTSTVSCGAGEDLISVSVSWTNSGGHNERNIVGSTINRSGDLDTATLEVNYDGGATTATYQPVAVCIF
jgi:hypothetical protein